MTTNRIAYVRNTNNIKILSQDVVLEIIQGAIIHTMIDGKLRKCKIGVTKEEEQITITHEVL